MNFENLTKSLRKRFKKSGEKSIEIEFYTRFGEESNLKLIKRRYFDQRENSIKRGYFDQKENPI